MWISEIYFHVHLVSSPFLSRPPVVISSTVERHKTWKPYSALTQKSQSRSAIPSPLDRIKISQPRPKKNQKKKIKVLLSQLGSGEVLVGCVWTTQLFFFSVSYADYSPPWFSISRRQLDDDPACLVSPSSYPDVGLPTLRGEQLRSHHARAFF